MGEVAGEEEVGNSIGWGVVQLLMRWRGGRVVFGNAGLFVLIYPS